MGLYVENAPVERVKNVCMLVHARVCARACVRACVLALRARVCVPYAYQLDLLAVPYSCSTCMTDSWADSSPHIDAIRCRLCRQPSDWAAEGLSLAAAHQQRHAGRSQSCCRCANAVCRTDCVPCAFQTIRNILSFAPRVLSIAAPPYSQAFSEDGTLSTLYRTWFDGLSQCDDGTAAILDSSRLGVDQMLGAFVFLLFGGLAAFAISNCENLKWCLVRAYSTPSAMVRACVRVCDAGLGAGGLQAAGGVLGGAGGGGGGWGLGLGAFPLRLAPSLGLHAHPPSL